MAALHRSAAEPGAEILRHWGTVRAGQVLNLDYRGRTVRISAEPGLQRRRDWGTVRQGKC